MKMGKRLAIALIASLHAFSLPTHAGNLKVLVWTSKDNPVMDGLVKEYRKTHKSTRITIEYVDDMNPTASLASKPDAYYGYKDFITQNTDLGVIGDLSGVIPSSDLKGVLPNLLGAYRFGGKLYGLPVVGSTSVMAYNRTMFRKAGLAEPKPSWTWEGDFRTACMKLSAKGDVGGPGATYGVVGLPQTDLIMPVFNSFGGRVTDDGIKRVLYTDRSGMAATDFIVGLHRDKLAFMPDWSKYTDNPASQPFTDGRTAMMVTSGTSLDASGWNKWLKENGMGYEVGITTVPRGPKGSVPVTFSNAVALLSTGRNKVEAAGFIRFIIGEKGQRALFDLTRGFPTTVKGLSYDRFMKSVPGSLVGGFRNGRPLPVWKTWNRAYQTMVEGLNGLITGKATMEDYTAKAKALQDEMDSGMY